MNIMFDIISEIDPNKIYFVPNYLIFYHRSEIHKLLRCIRYNLNIYNWNKWAGCSNHWKILLCYLEVMRSRNFSISSFKMMNMILLSSATTFTVAWKKPIWWSYFVWEGQISLIRYKKYLAKINKYQHRNRHRN